MAGDPQDTLDTLIMINVMCSAVGDENKELDKRILQLEVNELDRIVREAAGPDLYRPRRLPGSRRRYHAKLTLGTAEFDHLLWGPPTTGGSILTKAGDEPEETDSHTSSKK